MAHVISLQCYTYMETEVYIYMVSMDINSMQCASRVPVQHFMDMQLLSCTSYGYMGLYIWTYGYMTYRIHAVS